MVPMILWLSLDLPMDATDACFSTAIFPYVFIYVMYHGKFVAPALKAQKMKKTVTKKKESQEMKDDQTPLLEDPLKSNVVTKYKNVYRVVMAITSLGGAIVAVYPRIYVDDSNDDWAVQISFTVNALLGSYFAGYPATLALSIAMINIFC